MKAGFLRPHSSLISLITRLLDVVFVGFGAVVAFWLRFDAQGFPMPLSYGVLLLIAGLMVAVIFPVLGVYRSWRARGLMAPGARVLGAWTVVFLILLTLLLLTKQGESFSRVWLVGWWSVTGVMLVGLRTLIFSLLRMLRRRGYNLRNAVLLGCGPLARDLHRRAGDLSWAGFEVGAVFDVGGSECAMGSVNARPIAELWDYLENYDVDEIWIAVPLEQSARLREMLEHLRCTTANIRYVPDLFGLFLLNHGVSEILDMPMIDLSSSPMTGMNRFVKAIEDRSLAFFIVVLISPLMLMVALGIKLTSPGPVFFRQERVGWGGRPFQMLKFRSMPVDVEKDGVQWGNAKEKQVTPLGAFLRRTSLDELPQFLNVLKGDMSIVGPRPERPMFVEQFKKEIPGYMQKHMVKAGITGWAQINGWRGDTDLNKRIEFDLYYIENWSLIFDLKIIFLTIFRGFVHKNAY